MIIIKSQDDAATTALLERALKGQDIDIFQSDDDEYTPEELMSMLAYNAKQSRIYIGRLERNTRRLEEDMRSVARLLEPIASLATYQLEQTGEPMGILHGARVRREAEVAKQSVLSPNLKGLNHEGE